MDEFNETLDRQLSSVERGSPLWNECVEIVKTHAEVLSEVAVDFTVLVARGLDDQPFVNGRNDVQGQGVDVRKAPSGPRAQNGA